MRRSFIALAFAVLAAAAIAQSPTQRAAILSANPVLFRYTAGDSTSGATFTNASANRSYTDTTGTIQYAGVNVLRDSHHISSVRTTLLEGSRTNLILRSEEFDNAAWSKADITITANNTAGPSGAVTADLITEGTAGTAAITQSVAASTTIAQTIDIKAGTATWMRFVNHDSTTSANRGTIYANVATGTLGTASNGGTNTGTTARLTALANGWYRIELNTTFAGSVANSILVASATADGNLARTNNATYYLSGAQIEAAAFASSYIPTTTATVTRAADSLAYTLGSYPNWTRWEWFYNSAGVLTETVTTGTGSYSFTPTVDRAYRKIVIAKETRDVAYFAGYK